MLVMELIPEPTDSRLSIISASTPSSMEVVMTRPEDVELMDATEVLMLTMPEDVEDEVTETVATEFIIFWAGPNIVAGVEEDEEEKEEMVVLVVAMWPDRFPLLQVPVLPLLLLKLAPNADWGRSSLMHCKTLDEAGLKPMSSEDWSLPRG